MSAEGAELSRLRWRCRRGMRELDALLVRYLERRWQDAPEAERGDFLRLLDCEDDRLWRWLLGREAPDDDALQAILERIRQLPP